MRMKGSENKMKIKMRRKLLNRDTRRGTQKKRERENTNTTHLAQIGQTLKGKGEEKRRPTETDQDQRWGGRRTRLNQPTTAKPHARAQTYLERGARMKLGTNGG